MFPHYLINRKNYEENKKITDRKMCDLVSSTNFVLNILKRNKRDTIIMYVGLQFSLQILSQTFLILQRNKRDTIIWYVGLQFSLQILSQTFLILKRNKRDTIIIYVGLYVKKPFVLSIFNVQFNHQQMHFFILKTHQNLQ
jgi:hypothetical protein